jgi:hypothetical protein
MSQPTLCLEIQLRASLGLGWEDIFVILRRKGLVREQDRAALRRYVLGLGSKVAQRYGT